MASSSWESRDYSHLDQAERVEEATALGGELSAEDAASECFFDMLVQLNMTGVLTAKHVCIDSLTGEHGRLEWANGLS